MSNDKICTARLARRLLPQLPSKRLGYICQHLDITNEAAHRAKGDALATAQVFNHFQDLMNKQKITQVKDIVKFQTSKIRR